MHRRSRTRSIRRQYVGRLWDGVQTKWNVPENNCVINSTRRNRVETTTSNLPRWFVRFFQFRLCYEKKKQETVIVKLFKKTNRGYQYFYSRRDITLSVFAITFQWLYEI